MPFTVKCEMSHFNLTPCQESRAIIAYQLSFVHFYSSTIIETSHFLHFSFWSWLLTAVIGVGVEIEAEEVAMAAIIIIMPADQKGARNIVTM